MNRINIIYAANTFKFYDKCYISFLKKFSKKYKEQI